MPADTRSFRSLPGVVWSLLTRCNRFCIHVDSRNFQGSPARLRWSAGDAEAMPTGRNSAPPPSGSFRFTSSDRGLRQGAARLAAALICAAVLAGCGGGPWQEARTETEETARRVEALREAPQGPRFSAIRLVERRPYLGARASRGGGEATPSRAVARGRCGDAAAGRDRRGGDAGAADRGGHGARRALHPGRRPAPGTGPGPSGGIDRLSPDGGIWTGPLDALLDA